VQRLQAQATSLPWSLTGASRFYAATRFVTHCAPRLKRCVWHALSSLMHGCCLPDHLHCVWTLPDGDADFSNRWMKIKRAVSLACREEFYRDDWMTASKSRHRESTIWQRRFWEHQIRDENDFARHVDYIHHNPVKHGHVQHVSDWPYSTFHRYVREGLYSCDWAGVMNGAELEYD
jgi:REP element-mobilizing transposase RayT